MTESRSNLEWILLVHQLPPKPTNLRVRIWRKLQKLGAIAIKNSIYVLPYNDKTFEDFQWLKQEIESAGGEAALFRAGSVEGASDQEIIAGFRSARDQEYSAIAAALDAVTGAAREQERRGHLSVGRLRSGEAEADRLHKELERIASTDFFQASGGAAAFKAYERCRKSLFGSRRRGQKVDASGSRKPGSLDLAEFQGRLWITRRNLFVDRLATIWLIKRFIDKRARFSFIPNEAAVEGGIGFDVYGADLGHQGEDCTFETMMKRFDFGNDTALREISEIVHDIDLKDNRFNRLEANGLGAIITGLADLLKNDRKLVGQCLPLFDGLYELLGRRTGKAKEKNDGGRNGRRTARKGRQPRK